MMHSRSRIQFHQAPINLSHMASRAGEGRHVFLSPEVADQLGGPHAQWDLLFALAHALRASCVRSPLDFGFYRAVPGGWIEQRFWATFPAVNTILVVMPK
jgi:hypothetical protein